MTAHPIRFFPDGDAVRRVGEGLLARTLPRAEWTHEAHLAACLYLLRERPDLDLDRELRGIIAGYNAAVGGVNDDTGGYHRTITMTYLAGVRAFLGTRPPGEPLAVQANALLGAPEGGRDWPLRFYSEGRLMSVAARRGMVSPDRRALPGS